MSSDALLSENTSLRRALAARDEALAARDARIADLESQLDLVASKLKLTARERELLAQKLAQLLALRHRHPFLAPGQGILDFGDEPRALERDEAPEHVGEAPDGETPEDPIRLRHKPKDPARKLDTSSLPVEHVHHELPLEKRVCPITGTALIHVGERLEEEIDYEPGYLKRVVHHLAVYGPAPEDAQERKLPEVVTPGPMRSLPGSIAGAGLLAWILVQKYGRHLPLYRQEEILRRHGLRIPRQTTCDWVLGSARELGPIQQALRRNILASGVVQTDDTHVKCQAGKGKGLFKGYLWTTTSPLVEGVLYDFTESREHDHFFTMFAGLEEGVLLGDGYAGYETFAKTRRALVVAGCWVHVMRKFREALAEAPLFAASVLTEIGKLFDVEKKATEQGLSTEARLALRKRESSRILDAIDETIEGWRAVYYEEGKVGQACKYVENQRDCLRVFLDDGRVPLHNNACEVAVRPVAVGRKNWLFAGSVRGGEAAATIYTLVESCKKAGVDPYAYLKDVLVRVATHPASRIDELIPANWKRLFGASTASA